MQEIIGGLAGGTKRRNIQTVKTCGTYINSRDVGVIRKTEVEKRGLKIRKDKLQGGLLFNMAITFFACLLACTRICVPLQHVFPLALLPLGMSSYLPFFLAAFP